MMCCDAGHEPVSVLIVRSDEFRSEELRVREFQEDFPMDLRFWEVLSTKIPNKCRKRIPRAVEISSTVLGVLRTTCTGKFTSSLKRVALT